MWAVSQETAIEDAVGNVRQRLMSPLTRGVLDYWETKRGGRVWPLRADFDPAEVPRFLPYLALLGVEHEPLDFVYRLAGTEVDAHSAVPLTGRRASEIETQRQPGGIWALLSETAELGVPATRLVTYVGRFQDVRSCEVLALPLSTSERTLDRLLLALDFAVDGP